MTDLRNMGTERAPALQQEHPCADSVQAAAAGKGEEPDVDQADRSAMMARIRSQDTGPELKVRRALHRLGYRFRLHRRDLPGTPDVVLPGRKQVVLVNGCFWHRHPGCRLAYSPKTRLEFWQEKFRRNVERDQRVEDELRDQGWKVDVVWECETRDATTLDCRLREIMSATV